MSEQQTNTPVAATPEATAAVSDTRAEALAFLDNELSQVTNGDAPDTPAPAPKTEPDTAGFAKPADTEEAPKTEEPKTEETNRIAVAMRARVQAQRTRNDAEMAAAARLREVELKEQALAERERSMVSKLRERPIDALRELGLDPREFFERAVEDPRQLDPIRQVESKVERELAQLRQQNEMLLRSFEERQQQEQQRYVRSQQEQAHQQFVNDAIGGEHFPTLKALYGSEPERLTEEAIKVIRGYQERGGDASELSNHEIAEFLERREFERYSAVRSRLEQVGSEASQPAGGNVSLTSKTTATKNTRTRKAVSELSADEARAEAIRVLEEEIAGRKPRT